MNNKSDRKKQDDVLPHTLTHQSSQPQLACWKDTHSPRSTPGPLCGGSDSWGGEKESVCEAVRKCNSVKKQMNKEENRS